ncbi:MAG TPA: Fis family transcriptional regulator, partial [Planctomycetales bacterium]|nr:Fis family transcriptional regulator [Planctomycetales bacterium]
PEFLPPLHKAGDVSGDATLSVDLERYIDARLALGAEDLYAEAVRRLERILLPRVLRHTNGNQLRAAKLLGITRGSLRTKLRELGLRIDHTIV